MNRTKRLAAAGLSLCLAAALTAAPVGAAHTAPEVDTLWQLGILQGRAEGELALGENVTRAEAATLLYRITTGDVDGSGLSAPHLPAFSDVPIGDWYAPVVSWGAQEGHIGGRGDGSFGPNDPVTGWQMSAMLLRALGYTDEDGFSGPGWETDAAHYAALTGLTDGVTEPLDGPASRGLVSRLTHQALTGVATAGEDKRSTGQTLGQRHFGLTRSYPTHSLTPGDRFLLLDSTPHKQFDRYDELLVLLDGRAVLIRSEKGLVDELLAAAGGAPALYRVEALRGEQLSRASVPEEKLEQLRWAADGSLSITGGDWNTDGTGIRYEAGLDGYLPLAEGCRIYRVEGERFSPLTQKEVDGLQGWVAASDGRGYASLLYLLPTP